MLAGASNPPPPPFISLCLSLSLSLLSSPSCHFHVLWLIFFFPLIFFSVSLSHMFLCHTVMSNWHAHGSCIALSPSHTHTHTHCSTTIAHSQIMLHHVLYPVHVMCDTEWLGSSNERPLMGDYWCWALMPLTCQHQTCLSVSRCVYICVYRSMWSEAQSTITQSHDKEKTFTHQLKKWCANGGEGSRLRDCTMTGPRSVVQQLYIAQHGRQEIDI